MIGAVVELELDLSSKIQFDGTSWHVWIDRNLKWLNDGALQDILGLVPDIVERAFAEKEKANNGR
jgi:hypothetical protein